MSQLDCYMTVEDAIDFFQRESFGLKEEVLEIFT